MNTRAALHALAKTGALAKTSPGGYTVSAALRYALDET